MASYGFTFSAGDTVTPTRLNSARTVSDIVNADINASAAIAGTKIAPSFGNQDITFSTANRSITNTDNFALSLGTNNTERVNIEAGSAVVNITNADNSLNPAIRFRRAKGSPSAPTIVASGDNLGGMVCAGYDGTNYIASSVIRGEVDGTPGTNDMPGRLIFATTADGASSTTERLRITSSGDVGIGTVSPGAKLDVSGAVRAYGYAERTGSSGTYGGSFFNLNWTGAAELWIDTTNVGTITLTSDYRTKQNVTTQTTPALERIKQIRPIIYELADFGETFKADGKTREGFLAHELAAVVPSAVIGEKDAPNQIQSLRLDALCAVLVKAVQELTAKVAALEAAQ